MKHILNNAAQGEVAPWLTLDSEGVHYSGVIEEDPNYVDLGLPSGTLWAKCNVGAENEWEYGKYFQWGDTVGYYDGEGAAEHSTWATAPFNNGSSDFDESYFASVKDTVCPNGVLAPQYDAASAATNGVAHMPTQAELRELTANTTVTWETDFNGSGVNGRKFTASNGNYIFIPASGDVGNGSVYDRDSYGLVWSSSLRTYDPGCALDLSFGSSFMGVVGNDRYYGYSVRGVLVQN